MGDPPRTRLRLDSLLVERGLIESRQRAQLLIRAGQVRMNGQVVDKPSQVCDQGVELQVQREPPFVSRGGEKLQGALSAFEVRLLDRVCLDGGISTGGFTDCLLQRGARKIYGIDVGYGQVAWKLRQDPRLVLKERTNLRYLKPVDIYQPEDPWPDLAVVDVSFISLRLVLPALREVLVSPQELLLLVKPQFEAGRDRVGKHGVVRDEATHCEVIGHVWECACNLGWGFRGLASSPLTGPAGNHEYWLWLADTGDANLSTDCIKSVVSQTLS